MSKLWKLILLLLLIISATVWIAALQASGSNPKIIACDVGQGDGILIVYGSFEILTDGGPPNGKVVECLSRHLPFWDRTIEVVVSTHPEVDHYGGLIEVFKRYKVNYFVANPLDSGSQEYQLLKKEVGGEGSIVITPLSGKTISYNMMHYDIYFPTKEFLTLKGWDGIEGNLGSFNTKSDKNDFSVQALFSFGEFRALLTGDTGEKMKDAVFPNYPGGKVNYIKIPHHGSKYALTQSYIDLVKPEIAVISVGKNNYGHPTEEILDILGRNGIKTFRTDLRGDVVIETDGKRIIIN